LVRWNVQSGLNSAIVERTSEEKPLKQASASPRFAAQALALQARPSSRSIESNVNTPTPDLCLGTL
jgi:hypothetical protein